MGHKHDIAPNHTDGEADRPTDMDVDDAYKKKKKSHDLSDADDYGNGNIHPSSLGEDVKAEGKS